MKRWLISTAFIMTSLFATPILHACEHSGACGKSCSIGPYFISPQNGETVEKNIHIKMGIRGLSVHKAGELIDGTGHHHLIIDDQSIAEHAVVPKDAKHIHFGKGQTEASIQLTPGTHTLTLQFADGHHQSYGTLMSHTIKVIVK